jgi:hypothetical protein
VCVCVFVPVPQWCCKVIRNIYKYTNMVMPTIMQITFSLSYYIYYFTLLLHYTLHIKQETHKQRRFERSALRICDGFPYNQMWAESSVHRIPCSCAIGRIIRHDTFWVLSRWAESSV